MRHVIVKFAFNKSKMKILLKRKLLKGRDFFDHGGHADAIAKKGKRSEKKRSLLKDQILTAP